MKTPEEIFDEAIQDKGLDIVSVKDADLYEAGLDAINKALSIADVCKERELLKKLLELSYRIKWTEDEKKVWIEAENLVKTL